MQAGWPDWPYFRLLGIYIFSLGSFKINSEVAKNISDFFYKENVYVCINFAKTWVGLNLSWAKNTLIFITIFL
jgi:hypothetical protein